MKMFFLLFILPFADNIVRQKSAKTMGQRTATYDYSAMGKQFSQTMLALIGKHREKRTRKFSPFFVKLKIIAHLLLKLLLGGYKTLGDVLGRFICGGIFVEVAVN